MAGQTCLVADMILRRTERNRYETSRLSCRLQIRSFIISIYATNTWVFSRSIKKRILSSFHHKNDEKIHPGIKIKMQIPCSRQYSWCLVCPQHRASTSFWDTSGVKQRPTEACIACQCCILFALDADSSCRVHLHKVFCCSKWRWQKHRIGYKIVQYI